ncbi:MAG: hypothetical protein KatS3mg129_1074 [Leptospiraceae bacterium]|nr:MAG: hypothetical protein KatS3mg129_1074 [Leptospiraceae bacterium]
MLVNPIIWQCYLFSKEYKFFEAHEYLESIWISKNRIKNTELHGCIQFFAALELLKRNKNGDIVFTKSLNKIQNPKLKRLLIIAYSKYKITHKII